MRDGERRIKKTWGASLFLFAHSSLLLRWVSEAFVGVGSLQWVYENLSAAMNLGALGAGWNWKGGAGPSGFGDIFPFGGPWSE